MSQLIVQLKALTFRYPDGTPALDCITLDLARGERVALLGANGAGKSTLLLHLNGILQSPGVKVCGLALERRNLKAIRQKVGLVFQNPDDQLFCPTVFDDVAFGPRHMGLGEADVELRVARSLAQVGLTGQRGRSAFHLSVGQKKRAALATVLAMAPELLVLDEPTSNLDPRGRKEVRRLLQELGGTQLIATHDFTLVRELCQRAIVLSRGRKVADGGVEEVLGATALLEEHGLV